MVREGGEVIALSINLCFPVQRKTYYNLSFSVPLVMSLSCMTVLLRIREDKKEHSTEKD